MSYVLLIDHDPRESYEPPVPFGPFDTEAEAAAFAEDFREANGLPREATPENNELWTEPEWYFGIFELSTAVQVWTPPAEPLPYIVGVNGETPLRLRRFATEDEAARFIGTLEGAENGIYYLDGPESPDMRLSFPHRTSNWSPDMEHNVTLDHARDLYVIKGEHGFSCYGFDNALDEIERIVIELVGRGALPESYLDDELRSVKARRGTMQAWDTLQNLRAQLQKVCDEQGERAVCALSPQLQGLEGHRVEVVTTYGETRRFIVGKSTGWMPCHLEIKRRDSSGGGAAEREYAEVRDLGPVR